MLRRRGRKAEEARTAADKVAQETRGQLEEVQRSVRKGEFKPVFVPTLEEYNATKKRLQYQEGLFHFAVAGIAGSGKSSLINAFRGLRNKHRGAGAAPTGVTETTSVNHSLPPTPTLGTHLCGTDVPGAGTLKIPDFVYFNSQGLYIFDCVIVLFDARFTRHGHRDPSQLRAIQYSQHTSYAPSPSSTFAMSWRTWSGTMRKWMRRPGTMGMGRPWTLRPAKWARAQERYDLETRKSVMRNLEEAKLPPQRGLPSWTRRRWRK